jgi:hypothetical protein
VALPVLALVVLAVLILVPCGTSISLVVALLVLCGFGGGVDGWRGCGVRVRVVVAPVTRSGDEGAAACPACPALCGQHSPTTLAVVTCTPATKLTSSAPHTVPPVVPPPCTAGLLDFYVLAPLARVLQRRFSERDFTLRDRLGGGNYGQGGCCLAEGAMPWVAVE